MKNDFLSLVTKTFTKDEYGVSTPTEVIIPDIPCEVKSATAAEWFEGGRQGLNPDKTFIIRQLEYNYQETVIYDSIRYAVYRTYLKGDDIELHCQREKGA